MPPVVNPFEILASTDSTNNYAMGMIRDGSAKHGAAWFSHEQTQGKGRRGKQWNAEKGKNIMMSIAVNTGFLTVYQQFHLVVAATLGTISFFRRYAGDDCTIKWPNDIFWNDRKAGGILVENVIKGQTWQWAVIGIGININQTEFNLNSVFKPVSLKQVTGKDFDVIELARDLHASVIEKYDELLRDGIEKMLAEYNGCLYRLGKKVLLKKNTAVFETVVKGVSPEGKLITADTLERQFDFDEVNWLQHKEGDVSPGK